ncbi:hypothetical protein J4H86_03065 [Spiractinospora alimapuensis]|uniref:RNA ligase family protein n=1 Tax=Spiractinospora alimapuensis TaxID=2820884 RepID=UPI001F25157E|nr:RNA ligase family protein [Spiractinospora alimapuensis]QVQ52822.1 hypothetical protein J4H86_03065 [Spiractinospora alimapuensis]
MDDAPSPSAFRPYPKVANRAEGHARDTRAWVATEKVHGAHFAVVCDHVGARPAKRRALLDDDALDGFFGVSAVWPVLSVAASRFAAELRRVWDEAVEVTIYGELTGGAYPHPDVPNASGQQPVQTGVFYSPDLRWVLFDAAVRTSTEWWWIGDRSLREAATSAGLDCVPELARGPLGRLLDLPPVFPSEVPALLGLPALSDNLAEGYVVKPAGAWPESDPAFGPRPLAKVKQPSFSEDARFDGARPHLPPPEGTTGVPAWLLAHASTLLVPARAAAAVSKLGPRTPVEDVAEEIARDAVDELCADIGGLDDAQTCGLERALRPGALALARFDAADRRDSVST